MLGLIRRILSRNKKKHDPVEQSQLKTKHLVSGFITDQAKIETLLNEVEQQTPLCTVSLERTKKQFTTTILEIQANKSLIYIDELSPDHGNELLKKKHKIKISAQCNNLQLDFTLSRLIPCMAGGIIYYKAKLPKKIYYPQQRLSHRVATQSRAIAFKCALSQSQILIGQVVDISRGGIGIEITDNVECLKRGEILNNCQFYLPDNRTVRFDLSIRFAKPIRSRTKIKFGGYFEKISPKSQNKLAQYIALLET